MLYLGIDQHARQLTVSCRNEEGDVVKARQVSTKPTKVHAFFARLTHEAAGSGQAFVAVLEVGGFNDWLKRALRAAAPHEIRRFAHATGRDLAAVRMAFTSPWSNGQTEGHVNRLKMIKRQMYGRAGFDMLLIRFLNAA